MQAHRTRIKICGVRDVDTALVAADAGADAVGLVFVERSPRHVTVEQAARVVRRLPAFVEPVGLFVDAGTESIREIAATVGLSTVQLHGSEHPDQAVELAPLRVIKAMSFDPARAASIAAEWETAAERLTGWLWDCPPDDKPEALPGGTGRSFDWGTFVEARSSMGIPASTPVIVAGGLNPDNVADAVRMIQPWAVDVSSGVESERGVKDPDLIRTFCRAVGTADAAP